MDASEAMRKAYSLEDALEMLECLLDAGHDRDDLDVANIICRTCRDVMYYIVIAPTDEQEMQQAARLFEKALGQISSQGLPGERYKNIELRLKNVKNLLAGKPLERHAG